MSWKSLSSEARYHRIGFITLVTGLLAAAVVYRCTAPREYQPEGMIYRVEDGKTYAVDPSDLKKNQQDSWTKANMRTMEFLEWSGTWFHGRRLAYTLAGISLGGFLVCFFLANFEFHVAPPKDLPDRAEREQD